MSIKLWNTDINWLFLENTTINKAYLWDVEVFSSAPASTLLNWLLSYYKCDTNGSLPSSVNSPTNDWSLFWPTYTASWKTNWAYDFDWANDYAILPNSIIPWGTNEMSFSVWVKFDTVSGNKSIMMTGRTWKGCLIYQAWSGLVFSKPNVADLVYNYTVDTNWHLITCCSDWTWMKIARDWVVVTSNGNTANWVDPDWDDMRIWAYYFNWSLQGGWYFDWQFDEIWSWDRNLSVAEKAELDNSWTWLSYPFT